MILKRYLVFFPPVSEQFISKAVTENTLLLERLSKYLDRESRVIKCWKHLAFVLNVPAEETRKFDMFTENSPTEDMFFHLADVNPDLTVEVLKTKLKNIYRNDVIALLNEGMHLRAALILHHSCAAIFYIIIQSCL